MDIFRKFIVEPFERCFEKLLYFLPNLLTSILILLAGVVLGVVLKLIVLRIFKAINLDGLANRLGMSEMLTRSGIKNPLSLVLSALVKWITFVTFAVVAMQTLGIPAVERLLETFFLYLPHIFVAALILFLGYLLGNFFARAVLIASVNAGMRHAGTIARFVKFIIFILSLTMALEQLGIGRETVVIAFAIVFGGIVLAAAIACGLGGKDIAKEYLEKRIKGEEKKDEIDYL